MKARKVIATQHENTIYCKMEWTALGGSQVLVKGFVQGEPGRTLSRDIVKSFRIYRWEFGDR